MQTKIGSNHTPVLGFIYPEITHNERDLIFNDILFFYTDDVFSFFDNDHEKLLNYAQGSVDIANDTFLKQNIRLRRNISGVVRLPSSASLNDSSADHSDKLKKLVRFYDDIFNGYKSGYDASYVSAIIKHYPDNGTTVGLGYVSGMMTWISPYNNLAPRATLAHELGHNDGLGHDKDAIDVYGNAILRAFSVGTLCGKYDSIMHNTQDNRNETFFSSPLLTQSPDGDICGIQNEVDIVRAYQEGFTNDSETRAKAFNNNKPTPERKGEVNISLINNAIDEGQDIQVEVLWQGAITTAAVQVLVKRTDENISDVDSFMQAVYFYGDKTTQLISIPTNENDVFNLDKNVNIELIYPHKVSIGNGTVTAIIVNNDKGDPGKIAFLASTLRVNEGATATLDLQRTGGSDGEIRVNISTINGTATTGDYSEISEKVIFVDGETAKTISISTASDSVDEKNETFSLLLSGDASILGVVVETTVTVIEPTPPKNTDSSGGGSMNFLLIPLLVVAVSIRCFQLIAHLSLFGDT